MCTHTCRDTALLVPAWLACAEQPPQGRSVGIAAVLDLRVVPLHGRAIAGDHPIVRTADKNALPDEAALPRGLASSRGRTEGRCGRGGCSCHEARDRCNGRSSPRGPAAPRNGYRSSPRLHRSPFIAPRHHRPLSQARLPAAGPGATLPAIITPGGGLRAHLVPRQVTPGLIWPVAAGFAPSRGGSLFGLGMRLVITPAPRCRPVTTAPSIWPNR